MKDKNRRLNMYFLITKYPMLKDYIIACYKYNETEKLFNLLMSVQVEDKPTTH